MRITFLLILTSIISVAQEDNFISSDISINQHVDGTLLKPKTEKAVALAIIIPGSGPTDRNGNQNFLINNSLKKLAHGLISNNIASFRMDKRIVKQIRRGNLDLNVSLEDFVDDVNSVIDYFKDDATFNEIYIIGHDQGSLVGMLAINDYISGFISIAGAGNSLDNVLLEEINKTARNHYEDAKIVLAVLKQGKTTTDFPKELSTIFNKDIQPFMISWIKYDPKLVIKKLQIPSLILVGTKDLQVSIEESKLLSEAGTNSELKVINNMNHVMFPIEGDDLINSKSYNEPYRKISQELLECIVSFIAN